MQTINFLRNFFTKGIEIYSSFLSYFLDFLKKFKIGIFQKNYFSKFQIKKSPNFKFKKSLNFEPVPKG
jgi:hypothetical protein